MAVKSLVIDSQWTYDVCRLHSIMLEMPLLSLKVITRYHGNRIPKSTHILKLPPPHQKASSVYLFCGQCEGGFRESLAWQQRWDNNATTVRNTKQARKQRIFNNLWTSTLQLAFIFLSFPSFLQHLSNTLHIGVLTSFWRVSVCLSFYVSVLPSVGMCYSQSLVCVWFCLTVSFSC